MSGVRNPAAPYSYLSAGATNQDSQVVKAAAGYLYSLTIGNTANAARYVKIYDKAAAPTSADTPVQRFYLPATSDNSPPVPIDGLRFVKGLAFRITTGAADNDTGAASANDVVLSLGYN